MQRPPEKQIPFRQTNSFLDDLTPAILYTAAAALRENCYLLLPIAPAFKPSKKDRELLEKLYRPEEE